MENSFLHCYPVSKQDPYFLSFSENGTGGLFNVY